MEPLTQLTTFISENDDIQHLVEATRDWQFENGSLLKIPPASGKTLAYPIGVSLCPTPFPRQCFHQACRLQQIFNALYVKASSDEDWLRVSLQNLLDTESMARILWNIHLAVQKEGHVQPLSLGIFRSDYMLQAGGPTIQDASLQQVEFNTYSVAGGAHSNKASQMHR